MNFGSLNDTSNQQLQLTVNVVSAYVANNAVEAGQLCSLLNEVHSELGKMASGERASNENLKPAVPIKKSVHDDYIICLEDGKKFKSLKRHIMAYYNLTPEQYRAKWNLPADYPMVAVNYAKRRVEIAKQTGLGRGRKKSKAA